MRAPLAALAALTLLTLPTRSARADVSSRKVWFEDRRDLAPCAAARVGKACPGGGVCIQGRGLSPGVMGEWYTRQACLSPCEAHVRPGTARCAPDDVGKACPAGGTCQKLACDEQGGQATFCLDDDDLAMGSAGLARALRALPACSLVPALSACDEASCRVLVEGEDRRVYPVEIRRPAPLEDDRGGAGARSRPPVDGFQADELAKGNGRCMPRCDALAPPGAARCVFKTDGRGELLPPCQTGTCVTLAGCLGEPTFCVEPGQPLRRPAIPPPPPAPPPSAEADNPTRAPLAIAAGFVVAGAVALLMARRRRNVG